MDVCVLLHGERVGWRAAEAQARGEDESAIEHHQIKCYLILHSHKNSVRSTRSIG